MKTKAFRIISILMLVLLILAIVPVIGGPIAKSKLTKQYPAPGQLVDVGGYKMHINCMGHGSPTIILASGMSDFSVSWASVQPEIAKYTRVCSYDRAGLGWNEPSPNPRIASAIVDELHTLLCLDKRKYALIEKSSAMFGLDRSRTHLQARCRRRLGHAQIELKLFTEVIAIQLPSGGLRESGCRLQSQGKPFWLINSK